MPTIIESYAEFAERHGGNPMVVGGRRVFPDGASTDSYDMLRQDPPTGPALLKLKRGYFFAKLQKEMADRIAFKEHCSEQAKFHSMGSAPPPPANWREQLANGKARIDALTRQVAQLDIEIGKTPEEAAKRELWQQREQNGRDTRALLSEIAAS